MDLNFTPEESAFRQQVRSFMQEKLPADIRRKVLGGLIVERDDYVRWQRILHAQGWGVGVPSQFMSALPYLATVIVLVLISRARSGGSTAPAALGTVFVPDR